MFMTLPSITASAISERRLTAAARYARIAVQGCIAAAVRFTAGISTAANSVYALKMCFFRDIAAFVPCQNVLANKGKNTISMVY